MSLLNMFTGDNADAMIAVGGGLLSRNPAAGFARAQNLLAEAPYRRLQMEQQRMQMEQAQLQQQEAQRKRDYLQNLPGMGSPSPQNAMLLDGVRAGVIPLDTYIKSMQPKGIEFSKVDPKDYTPESVRAAAATGDYTQLVPVRKADVVNGQAVNLYDAKPGTVFDNINPNQPFNLRGGQAVPNTPFQQYETNKARAGASNVSVNTGQKGLDNELSIHSKWRAEPIYKAHQEVQSAHSQITSALKQASPAGDLAGATKLMKILDPGSVVRESELGMAMAASGALDRLQHYAANVMNGTKLTPTQRADFQRLADSLYDESGKQYNQKQAEYAKFASEYGLNAGRIVGPAVTSPKRPTAPVFPSAPSGQKGGAKFLGFE